MENVLHLINATAQKDGLAILALKVNLLYVSALIFHAVVNL